MDLTAEEDAMLADAVGHPMASSPTHIGFWDLRVKVATAYRRGRMPIAGDATRRHPPYGGFGLNTRPEEVANPGGSWPASLRAGQTTTEFALSPPTHRRASRILAWNGKAPKAPHASA